ncbi:hypothetical protein [Natronobeatus ordinarius]|uniref:hypothetical protein n=1 Tax=Natronobeatus ordinarius TaxID=2963433 RepID=UPI0020CF3A01|nr:hypothetical protein [Natronobeatus ordinarius]
MTELEVVLAGFAVVFAVGVGLVAHEWSHALVLTVADVDHALEYLPDRTDGVVGALASTRWARVRPQPTGREPPWVLRLAALMPLTLALPVLGLGVSGYLSSDDLVVTLAVAGWLACAIPSPQDFSVAFYAHRILAEARDDETNTRA